MTDQAPPVDGLHDNLSSADEDVAKLRLQMSHKSVEELVEDGLVKWDKEANVVVKGPRFDRGRPLKE
ncbi:hypothetical protein M0R89_22065 (plasmid) [Halorussus limi]|uniref:Uncharacterized protein n=1 Tax=Halorussus limi TaxID=2938695 RepID=A0A8U0I166_9EURY|nr:hypothetical protein [Halorussus limi]UPV77105.1 hypothetical protein M0R89_22065 [Halorussus limi]